MRRLTDTPGYDAEGSYSPDGKHIVFCSNRGGADNLELYIMDRDGKNVRQLTHAPGCYNGGPFFSPDGKRVIFRSDRKKKDHLQLFVINADGSGERALTDDFNWVQWGPYWYKDSKHIVYAGANHAVAGRPNYDLYWMNVETRQESAADLRSGRRCLAGVQPGRQTTDVDFNARRPATVAVVDRRISYRQRMSSRVGSTSAFRGKRHRENKTSLPSERRTGTPSFYPS